MGNSYFLSARDKDVLMLCISPSTIITDRFIPRRRKECEKTSIITRKCVITIIIVVTSANFHFLYQSYISIILVLIFSEIVPLQIDFLRHNNILMNLGIDEVTIQKGGGHLYIIFMSGQLKMTSGKIINVQKCQNSFLEWNGHT